jgi:serine O-acetyltransferase
MVLPEFEPLQARTKHSKVMKSAFRQSAGENVATARPYFDRLLDEVRARQPRFTTAVVRDAKIYAAGHGERHEFRGRVDAFCQVLRLMWSADAFLAMVLYRAQARLDALRVPLLPRLAKHLANTTGQICIGRAVVIEPGVFIAHGQVVIDGFTTIERDCIIRPFVSIGLRQGDFRGPTIRRGAQIGTGSRVLGNITLHRDAIVGANAVVVGDVPAGATVVGVPARVLNGTQPE